MHRGVPGRYVGAATAAAADAGAARRRRPGGRSSRGCCPRLADGFTAQAGDGGRASRAPWSPATTVVLAPGRPPAAGRGTGWPQREDPARGGLGRVTVAEPRGGPAGLGRRAPAGRRCCPATWPRPSRRWAPTCPGDAEAVAARLRGLAGRDQAGRGCWCSTTCPTRPTWTGSGRRAGRDGSWSRPRIPRRCPAISQGPGLCRSGCSARARR